VTSIDSFERYQRGRGSNTAWTWEHQAITRARYCAGDAQLGERFEATRRAVIESARDADALRHEIATMRRKVRDANPQRDDRIDPKHCEGGLMDIEFAMQYLVLAHGRVHPGPAGQPGQHRPAETRRGGAVARARHRHGGRRRLPRAAPRAAPRAPRRAADAVPARDARARARRGRALWRAVFGPGS
jgi:glutamate-ammonia-ligase adenylyltransferase